MLLFSLSLAEKIISSFQAYLFSFVVRELHYHIPSLRTPSNESRSSHGGDQPAPQRKEERKGSDSHAPHGNDGRPRSRSAMQSSPRPGSRSSPHAFKDPPGSVAAAAAHLSPVLHPGVPPGSIAGGPPFPPGAPHPGRETSSECLCGCYRCIGRANWVILCRGMVILYTGPCHKGFRPIVQRHGSVLLRTFIIHQRISTFSRQHCVNFLSTLDLTILPVSDQAASRSPWPGESQENCFWGIREVRKFESYLILTYIQRCS